MTRPLFWVVVAAGLGARLSAGTRKAGVLLDGTPMVVRALRAVSGTPGSIGGALVVHPADLVRAREEWVPAVGTDLPWQVVLGGDTRARSVENGLDAAPDEAEVIAVHDAARPLLAEEDRDRVVARVASPERWEAVHGAILALPVADTLKEVAGDRIVGTVDRTPLWGAQTPQVFTREALAHARASGVCEGTDEASWLVAAGLDVRVVAARHPNPKVTLPADLVACEERLRARRP